MVSLSSQVSSGSHLSQTTSTQSKFSQLLFDGLGFIHHWPFFRMHFTTATAVALMAFAAAADATFVFTTAAATAGTATTISSASAASLGLLGGVVLLKGLVLGAALLSRRGKRSAENDYAFIALNNAEPASCYKRLICDLATGAIPDSDNILSLFNGETEVISPKFEYSTAAKLGKAVKNAQVCEVRYSCPLNNQEIAKLFA